MALMACADDDPHPPDGAVDQDGAAGESPSGDAGDGGDGELDAGADAAEEEPDASGAFEDAGADAGGGATPDAGSQDAGEDASIDAGEDAGELPLSLGGLSVTTTPDEQALDLFGAPGHRFWIEVDEHQLARLNAGGGFGQGEDIYVPVVSGAYSTHLLVQDAISGSVADYGKMEIKLVGESTFRQWDLGHIPNIHIDTDEFQKKARIGSFEHFRLNNSVVGSIFREAIAHRIFMELDYPALRASFAFLGSNVWGDGVWVPMTLIEMYKLRFCDDNAELLGGTCLNMWEFAGDIGNGGGAPGPFPHEPFPLFLPQDGRGGDAMPLPNLPVNACQIKECDDTRLNETMQALAETPLGPGFKEALDPYIEWSFFHRFQCLDWMLWIGDDPIHNSNNNLIVERDDGKLIWAPYSVDISAGQEWYQNIPLLGSNALSRGCQSDPQCWADTVAACDELIARFDALDPEHIVDETVETLSALEMMRSGDANRGQALRQWYVQRQLDLPAELERFRYIPDLDGVCPNGLEACNDGGCGTFEQCQERMCEPGRLWCESLESCYDPGWETCPHCTELEPYYCGALNTCVASLDECQEECSEGDEWCHAYGYCAPIGECGGAQEDAGLEPFPEPFPAMGGGILMQD